MLGEDHPNILSSMNSLAYVYYRQGRLEEAEALHRQTLETRRRVLGDDHPDMLRSMYNLANVYDSQGRYEEAEAATPPDARDPAPCDWREPPGHVQFHEQPSQRLRQPRPLRGG